MAASPEAIPTAKAVSGSWAGKQATERGIQALLRDRIVQAYYHYSERNWITLHGLENVEALYREYHALGGNGTVTKLVEALRELEVRDK